MMPYIKDAAGIFFSGKWFNSNSLDKIAVTTGHRTDSFFIISVIHVWSASPLWHLFRNSDGSVLLAISNMARTSFNEEAKLLVADGLAG